jgi:hypothetical protein
MRVTRIGSLVFGRLFDRLGISVPFPLPLISALSALFVFLGDFWLALLDSALWGLKMGVAAAASRAMIALTAGV